MRGQSRTRQTLSDACEPMNLEDWFVETQGKKVTSLHMIITETEIDRSSANGDSRIEINEESRSRKRRSGTPTAKKCGRETSRD